MIERARALGLTHLAITDHERIDGAQRAADLAPADLQVIVGEEIRTRQGDLLGLFLGSPWRPARARRTRPRPSGRREGSSGCPTPSMAGAPPAAAVPGKGRTPRRAGRRGRLRRGPQRTRLSRGEPRGRRLRGPPRAARRRLVRRPQRHGDGHRQHGPARALHHRGGAPGTAARGEAASPVAPRTTCASGPPWPSSSSGCGATAASCRTRPPRRTP